MAKSFDMNMVERHLEKAILGLAVIVFAYAVFSWGLASPNIADVFTISGDEKITPDQIDARLAKTSNDVHDKMKGVSPKIPPLNNYAAVLKKMQDGPDMERGFAIDFGTGRLPLAGTDRNRPLIKPVGVAKLAALAPRPETPNLLAGRELPRVEPPADQMVAHGVTVYPWDELIRRWNAELAEAGITFRPVVLDMIAEYQEMRSDGSWPADSDVRPVRLSATADLKVPAIPSFNGKNADEIEKIKGELLAKWQDKILQPEYPSVWLPDVGWIRWWANNQVEGASEVTAMIESVASAATGASPSSAPAAAEPESATPPAAAPPAKTVPPRKGAGPVGSGGRTSIVSPAAAPSTPAVHLKTQDVEPALAIPPIDTQKHAGKVLVWFHDKPLDTTRAYRYRVRLVLLNPLLGSPSKVLQSAADNTVVSIVTPPSEWSRPVRVFKGMEFFVTGANSALKMVNVSVFAHCLGQRVRHTFKVEIGRSIGEGKIKVPVVNPLNEKLVLVETDFETGAAAVAFDFAKRYLKEGLSKETTTTQVLYLDEKGNLRSKILAGDEESPLNKRLKKEAQATEDAAKAAK